MISGSFSFKEFNKRYPDDDACLEVLFKLNNLGKPCKECGCKSFFRVKTRKCYACGKCGHHIYPMIGTVMEGSKTSLQKWFYIIYEVVQSKNCVSALEVKRKIGVTYKCAWRMMHRIRERMGCEDFSKLFNEVEIDETWVGGKKKNKNKVGYNGMENKTIVMGLRERGKEGRVRTFIIESRSNKVMLPIIYNNVTKGSTIYTDEYPVYKKVCEEGYIHKFIKHKKYQFANGDITTNRIESYWSYVKNNIRGTYKSVSNKWLPNYLKEFDFRYNQRKNGVEVQFNNLVKLLFTNPSSCIKGQEGH